MPATISRRLDERDRLGIPQKFRDRLGLKAGDTLFIQADEDDPTVLRVAKAENPFDGLARYAEQGYRAGRTQSLEDFARDNDIDSDEAG